MPTRRRGVAFTRAPAPTPVCRGVPGTMIFELPPADLAASAFTITIAVQHYIFLLQWCVSGHDRKVTFSNSFIRQPKERRHKTTGHESSVKAPYKRQFAIQDNAVERVDIGGLADAPVKHYIKSCPTQ